MNVAKTVNFYELIGAVEDAWPFDLENYPDLPADSLEGRRIFAIRHMALHLGKEVGKLNALLEKLDHKVRPSPWDDSDVREITLAIIRDLQLCAWRLAPLLDIPPDYIEQAIRAWFQDEALRKQTF